MKEETLFDAIGAVEDRFLKELEEIPVRRLPKHFGLAAALIALLLTAATGIAVRIAIGVSVRIAAGVA